MYPSDTRNTFGLCLPRLRLRLRRGDGVGKKAFGFRKPKAFKCLKSRQKTERFFVASRKKESKESRRLSTAFLRHRLAVGVGEGEVKFSLLYFTEQLKALAYVKT